jgi:hypothetical protein
MFLETQDKTKLDYYRKLLAAIASLSKLFSTSDNPLIPYRVAENIFCNTFQADNISRSDFAVDASINGIGIGLKTFLYKKGQSFEKISEFNKESKNIINLSEPDIINNISYLRNQRLEASKRIFNLSDLIYHCVTRGKSKVIIYECPMNFIDIGNISNIKKSINNIIYFNDCINEYSFNISKSTLYKKFKANDIIMDFNIDIFENPFNLLEEIFDKYQSKDIISPIRDQEHIFLPLYSVKNHIKNVPEKSGLNQWNAAGRPRDYNEIYIPIPSFINKIFPTFFPPRHTSFNLLLPNKQTMIAKVSQDNSKALMSNPNSALGKWLLRDVLNLNEGEVLDYQKLEDIGLDSVVIYKIKDDTFDIDFAEVDSFEEWHQSILIDLPLS